MPPPHTPTGIGVFGADARALGRRLQHKDSLVDWDSVMDCQGTQSQKEGQEDKGTLKQRGVVPP